MQVNLRVYYKISDSNSSDFFFNLVIYLFQFLPEVYFILYWMNLKLFENCLWSQELVENVFTLRQNESDISKTL
jgi:hypothetical protein